MTYSRISRAMTVTRPYASAAIKYGEIVGAVAAPAVAFVWPGYSRLSNGFLVPLVEVALLAIVGGVTGHEAKMFAARFEKPREGETQEEFKKRKEREAREAREDKPLLVPVFRKVIKYSLMGAGALGVVYFAAKHDWVDPNDNVVRGALAVGDASGVNSMTDTITHDKIPDAPGSAIARITQNGDLVNGQIPGVMIVNQKVCLLNIIGDKGEVAINGGYTRIRVELKKLISDPGGIGCQINPAVPNPVVPHVAPSYPHIPAARPGSSAPAAFGRN